MNAVSLPSLKEPLLRCLLATAALALIELSVLPAAGQTKADFALHDGDRVALFGDSITEQRKYSAEVEAYVLTRFPHRDIRFHGVGVGGDKVSGGYMGPIDLRLDRDIFTWHPSVITMMLGMNDGYYRADEPGIYLTYTNGIDYILKRFKEKVPAARVTVLAPSPYDDITREPNFPGGYNAVLLKYGNYLHDVSQKHDLDFADMNAPVVELLKRANADSKELAQMLLPDRVHPAKGATWIMAESLLKSWHAPSIVSAVALDAESHAVIHAANATVTNVQGGRKHLSWDTLEEALPLPFYSPDADPVVAAGLQYSDLIQALDQETLSIRGLHDARYQVIIDYQPVGSFSSEQLATGINLALLETPMLQQARLVGEDTDKRNDLEQAVMSSISQSLAAETSPYSKALEALAERARMQQHLDAQPKKHHFEVVDQGR
jgi:lysophospholipase L1-like esterase